jgi:hypothetical protein
VKALAYLRANGFKTFIVPVGGWQEGGELRSLVTQYPAACCGVVCFRQPQRIFSSMSIFDTPASVIS